MSNVSVVSPYVVRQTGEAIGSAVTAVASCAAAVATWLAETDGVETAALSRSRTEALSARLGSAAGIDRAVRLGANGHATQAVPLRAANAGPLLRCAERLGYSVRSIAGGHAVAGNRRDVIALERQSGERIAIVPTDAGMELHTAGHRDLLHEIVKHDVIERTKAHFKLRGLEPRITVRRDGAVEVAADEANATTNNPALMTARVYDDGRVRLDVDCKGNKCEQLRRDYMENLNLDLEGERKKDSFFTLPGEPARTDVKV